MHDVEDAQSYLVLLNGEDQHSLWPTFARPPEGWCKVYGPATKSACLEYVETHWIDMRPKSLRDCTEPT